MSYIVTVWTEVLIDSCVLVDSLLAFRKNHESARKLLEVLRLSKVSCLIPAHAYFELYAAAIVHFKNDREKLELNPVHPALVPVLNLNVVTLSNEYVETLLAELSGGPIPDLKSQDMIYFCIARNRKAPLITEDVKLRNTARKGGLAAFNAEEAITELEAQQRASPPCQHS